MRESGQVPRSPRWHGDGPDRRRLKIKEQLWVSDCGLSVTRTVRGMRSATDGAHIKFGKGRGQFTPGDLMKVALAGCAALSSQFAIEHTLGEGKGAKIVVDGTYDPENDAYTGFEEQVVIDASDAGLSEEDADKLKERVTRHIDKGCTVKHTYVQETPVRMNVTVKH